MSVPISQAESRKNKKNTKPSSASKHINWQPKRLGTTAMNTIKKPTTRDALESIKWDYKYPFMYMGNTQLILSKDFNNRVSIEYMEALENFVDRAAKSKTLPFIFDKNLKETVLNTQNKLGKLFYELLNKQNNIFNQNPYLLNTIIPNNHRIQHKYEVSENTAILHEVVSSLNLIGFNFTGEPKSKITNDGLLEGELINNLITCLQKATKRKSFKTRVEERKNEFSQSFLKTKRYIDRLCTNTPSLFGMQIVVCYQSEYANTITLAQSNRHLTKFLEALEADLKQGNPVGWWWKREYMSELGYFYYLIVFFDYLPIPTWFYDTYKDHWSSVTGEQGETFTPNIPIRDFQRGGSEVPRLSNFIEGFVSTIQRMFMRDIYLRLERDPEFNHFGMGKFPKLTNVLSLK
jgi:hypothetical protein